MLALVVAQDSVLAQSTLPPITIGATPATQARPSSGQERGYRTASRADEKKPDTIIGAPDTPSTEYTVDRRGMEITALGGASAIRAIANLPGVDAPAIDPYGVANLPGGNKGIRVRGELMGGGNSIGTVDGIPLSGINPGPGVTWLIDNENLSKIVLRQGPIPSDVSSYFTIGGVIDSRLRWPEKKMGGEISQSVGSFSFFPDLRPARHRRIPQRNHQGFPFRHMDGRGQMARRRQESAREIGFRHRHRNDPHRRFHRENIRRKVEL